MVIGRVGGRHKKFVELINNWDRKKKNGAKEASSNIKAEAVPIRDRNRKHILRGDSETQR